jgi:hypothetical protein
MFAFLRKKKQELPLAYEKLLKKLNKKYPGKYLSVVVEYRYFDHNEEGYDKTEYTVYVEDNIHEYFPTFSEVEKYIQYLCKKET